LTHRVLLASSARKDLDGLPGDVRDIILHEISLLENVPRPPGSKKLKGQAHNWRIRVRDWRVLYAIETRQAVIKIYRIRHRKEVYR
jgi:mRNA interferase RelE/StbE